MLSGRLCIEEGVEPAMAVARGSVLWESVSAQRPVAMYGATLRGEAWVLGAYQRADEALSKTQRSEGSRVVRRRSGGITVRAGDGIVYAALGLHDRSTLMSCPKNRILNRNVRGALQGLRLLGVPAHYFGRDFISVAAHPAVFVGWSSTRDGRVLLEMFISETRTYVPPADAVGYPAHSADVLRQKELTTLQAAGARALGSEVIEKLAAGYATMAPIDWQRESLSEGELAKAAQAAAAPDVHASDAQLAWSAPREEAIGFVSAGAALDGSGKLADVRLAGDFFQDEGCAQALRRALLGVEPSPELLGHALDTVYARAGHELEGVRTLDTFRQALLDAVARTRT